LTTSSKFLRKVKSHAPALIKFIRFRSATASQEVDGRWMSVGLK